MLLTPTAPSVGRTQPCAPPAGGRAHAAVPGARTRGSQAAAAPRRTGWAAASRRCAQHVLASATEAAPAKNEAVEKAFKALQNGSDIRGIAIEGVEGEARNLTPKVAYFLGVGLAELLAERVGKPAEQLRVSIGRDPRLSGAALQAGLTAGLTSQGVAVAQFGIATTPAMFMSCVLGEKKADGSVMITASHLPFNRNGFKFFDAKAGFEKGDISALLERAVGAVGGGGLQMPPFPADKGMADPDVVKQISQIFSTNEELVSQEDFMPVYAAHLREIIRKGIGQDAGEKPLEGFKIAVDAGNGSGGFLATDVLAPLGADTSGSQFLEPDGTFPNHVPNPEDKAAMQAAVQAVQASQADLGIVVDTDVDRSAVVAGGGEPINSNRYIALMAAIALRKYPGSTIVTDSVTSNGLSAFIAGLGGKHFRYRRGYKNVIGKGVELAREGTDCQLMMETSGHGAMAENYCLDDGTYSASQIVVELVRRRRAGEGGIGELLAQLQEPADSREYRLKLKQESFKQDGQAVLQKFHDWVAGGAGGAGGWALEAENHEGWRVAVEEGDGRKGWLLLRASLHDPLLVLNVESDLQDGAPGIVQRLLPFFREEAKDVSVDTSKLESA